MGVSKNIVIGGYGASLRSFATLLKRAIDDALADRSDASDALTGSVALFQSDVPPENMCWVGGSLAAACNSDQLARASLASETYASSGPILDEYDLRRSRGAAITDDDDGDHDTFVIKSFEKVSVSFGTEVQ